MILQTYFDFKKLFKTTLYNTLGECKTFEEHIEFMHPNDAEDIENVKTLYKFISNQKEIDNLLVNFDISEEQNSIDFESEYVYISFSEDTSVHNEGGSHFGGYEYIFGINTELEIFSGLEIINHN